MTGKVYNKSRERVEKAKLVVCPRCRGFGGVFGDAGRGDVCICNGRGRVWRSESGWIRAMYKRIEASFLW